MDLPLNTQIYCHLRRCGSQGTLSFSHTTPRCLSFPLIQTFLSLRAGASMTEVYRSLFLPLRLVPKLCTHRTQNVFTHARCGHRMQREGRIVHKRFYLPGAEGEEREEGEGMEEEEEERNEDIGGEEVGSKKRKREEREQKSRKERKAGAKAEGIGRGEDNEGEVPSVREGSETVCEEGEPANEERVTANEVAVRGWGEMDGGRRATDAPRHSPRHPRPTPPIASPDSLPLSHSPSPTPPPSSSVPSDPSVVHVEYAHLPNTPPNDPSPSPSLPPSPSSSTPNTFSSSLPTIADVIDVTSMMQMSPHIRGERRRRELSQTSTSFGRKFLDKVMAEKAPLLSILSHSILFLPSSSSSPSSPSSPPFLCFSEIFSRSFLTLPLPRRRGQGFHDERQTDILFSPFFHPIQGRPFIVPSFFYKRDWSHDGSKDGVTGHPPPGRAPPPPHSLRIPSLSFRFSAFVYRLFGKML